MGWPRLHGRARPCGGYPTENTGGVGYCCYSAIQRPRSHGKPSQAAPKKQRGAFLFSSAPSQNPSKAKPNQTNPTWKNTYLFGAKKPTTARQNAHLPSPRVFGTKNPGEGSGRLPSPSACPAPTPGGRSQRKVQATAACLHRCHMRAELAMHGRAPKFQSACRSGSAGPGARLSAQPHGLCDS